MADINVVRRTPAVLPWLVGLGLLLLGAVAWLTWGSDDAPAFSESAPERQAMPADLPALPAEVTAYRSFADSPGPLAAGPSHEYAATGIRRLSEALRAVAAVDVAGNQQLSQQLTLFQERADRLQRDPQSLNHADDVRETFIAAADVTANIYKARAAGSHVAKDRVDDLRRTAESIDAGRPLLDQQEKMTRFFSQSADVLASLTARQAS